MKKLSILIMMATFPLFVEAQTAAEAVDRFLNAAGGEDKIAAIKTFQYKRGYKANAAITETGNLSDAVESGLLTGTRFSDGGPARFQRSDPYLLGGAGRKRSVRGALVDDNGLWSFIPASLTSTGGAGGNVPESCQRNQFVDGSGTPTMDNLPTNIKTHVAGMALTDRMLSLLTRCFSHYSGTAWGGGASAGEPALTPAEPRVGCGAGSTPCTDPVFGLNVTNIDSPDLFDLQYTPRFAYVPELTAAFPSGAATAVRFQGFRAVFIQRISLGTGASPTNFDPGVGTTALNPSGSGVREVTMWVFPQNMLPGRLQETNAAYAIGVNRFAQLVRYRLSGRTQVSFTRLGARGGDRTRTAPRGRRGLSPPRLPIPPPGPDERG